MTFENSPIRVVSLFAGIGAPELGLRVAAAELDIDVEVVAAIDSWDAAVRVYNANHTPVAYVADVKKLTRADLPPHDLVIGGPPCQDHSMAGLRKCKCHVGGDATERCCLADFVRLSEGSAWIMENVASRLISAPWSEKLCAADFGDVTARKRWFYSNYLLHVVPTPGPRRIRDIRDHDEDARVLAKRAGCKAGKHGHYDSLDSLDSLGSLTAHSWHGHDVRNGKLIPIPEDGVLGSITSSPHGGISGGGKGHPNVLAIVTHRPRTNEQGCEPYATIADEADVFGSLTADMPRAYSGSELTQSEARLHLALRQPNPASANARALKLGLRGNSASASASAFEDDEVLGSVLANSFHGNEASKLVGCRNPSLLEMARAHSIPDSWDWAGATKTQRGQMIANSWPAGMAKAVCKAMLTALIAERAA